MLVVEAKLKNGTPEQYQKLDEAIRTSQFVRNSCVRYWMDNQGTTRNDLQKLCAVLANNKETIGVLGNIIFICWCHSLLLVITTTTCHPLSLAANAHVSIFKS